MDKRISSQIHKLSAYTDGVYKNIQRIYIPSVYNLHVERMYNTHYDLSDLGFIRASLTFVSNNIPILYHKIGDTFTGTLDTLIERGFIQPMLIFYQGKFVKWTDVAIKVTHRYNNIFIKNIEINKYTGHSDIQCILLPLNGIYYREGIKSSDLEDNSFFKDETPIFTFNSDGLLVSGDPNNPYDTYTIVSSLSHRNDFKIEQFRCYSNKTYESSIIPKYKYLSDQNIIYFKNNKLPTKLYNKDEFSKKGHSKFMISDVDDSLYDVKIFFYYHGNDSKNAITTIPTPDEKLYDLNENFNFDFDIHRSYEQNITNALRYCMSYNSGFMNDIYKQISNVKSVRYTGKHMKSLANEFKRVRMSTRVDGENYNKVIIYHNGDLFYYYNTLEYINKDFRFYLDDSSVKDDDVFEFVFFKKSYNVEKEITFDSGGDDHYYIGEDVELDDFTLYSTNLYSEHKFFDVEVSELAQYQIPFEYTLKEDNIFEIIPSHSYYYDKDCTLVSNRQFHYQFRKIMSDNTFSFELNNNFKFCTDISRYMVYVNGKRINSSNFKVTIVKHTRPFYSHSIYLNIPLSVSDRVEVFYVPDKLYEVYIDKKLNPKDGTIIVDKSKLTYNLDKDLYLFFINGKKVLPEDIQDISKNIVKIKTSESIYNVSIVKHINTIDVLGRMFRYTDDILDMMLQSIDENELSAKFNEMYGSSDIKDKTTPFDSEAINMKHILHTIIRDYWNKPYITNGDEFIYDFDTDSLDLDSDGNIIIPSMDGTYYN